MHECGCETTCVRACEGVRIDQSFLSRSCPTRVPRVHTQTPAYTHTDTYIYTSICAHIRFAAHNSYTHTHAFACQRAYTPCTAPASGALQGRRSCCRGATPPPCQAAGACSTGTRPGWVGGWVGVRLCSACVRVREGGRMDRWVGARVRAWDACVCACVCACVRACVRARVGLSLLLSETLRRLSFSRSERVRLWSCVEWQEAVDTHSHACRREGTKRRGAKKATTDKRTQESPPHESAHVHTRRHTFSHARTHTARAHARTFLRASTSSHFVPSK